MKSFYKSEAGKQQVLTLYDQKLESLSIDYREQDIATSFGRTRVISTGKRDGPPLIIVHGSNACAPIALETYPNLAGHFRVYAVDVPAQPNKSEGTRMSMKDQSYGKWMNEVITALGLDAVTLVGFSFGGLIILKTLIQDDSRIKEAILAAPAYIVNGNPLRALFRIFIPMRRYMRSRDQRHVEQFLNELFTDRDAFAVQFLSAVFQHFEMDFTPVPVISSSEAGSIRKPITLFAAEDDLLFPGKKMVKRAGKIFPSLKSASLLEASKHVQNRADNTRVEQAIIASL